MCIMSRVKLCKGALHKMAKYGTNVGEYIGTSDDGTVLLLVNFYRERNRRAVPDVSDTSL